MPDYFGAVVLFVWNDIWHWWNTEEICGQFGSL